MSKSKTKLRAMSLVAAFAVAPMISIGGVGGAFAQDQPNNAESTVPVQDPATEASTAAEAELSKTGIAVDGPNGEVVLPLIETPESSLNNKAEPITPATDGDDGAEPVAAYIPDANLLQCVADAVGNPVPTEADVAELTYLECRTPIADLTGIGSAPLTKLSLLVLDGVNTFTNLDALAGTPSDMNIEIAHIPELTDVSGLAHNTTGNIFIADADKLTDVSVLNQPGTKRGSFQLLSTGVTNLGETFPCASWALNITGNLSLTSLPPVDPACGETKTVWVGQNAVTDLRGFSPETLELSATNQYLTMNAAYGETITLPKIYTRDGRELKFEMSEYPDPAVVSTLTGNSVVAERKYPKNECTGPGFVWVVWNDDASTDDQAALDASGYQYAGFSGKLQISFACPVVEPEPTTPASPNPDENNGGVVTNPDESVMNQGGVTAVPAAVANAANVGGLAETGSDDLLPISGIAVLVMLLGVAFVGFRRKSVAE